MTIVPMTFEHVDDVARLHCAGLSGLVSMLGERAARAFYTGCVRSAFAVGFVAVEDGAVRGFVLGSVHPVRLRRDLLGRNPLGVMIGMGEGILRRPSALAWLLRSFRGPDAGSYDDRAAELTYLAVAPAARGHGIGRQLVDAFAVAMREKGVAAFELSVDEDNPQAIRFYEGMGFQRIGQYREFGRLHVRYREDAGGGVSTS